MPARHRSYPWRPSPVSACVRQALLLALVLGGLAWFGHNAALKLAEQGVSGGFAFLGREAGFAIAESPLAYGPGDSYLRALAVGLLNTLKVAAPALLGATLLGTLVGIGLRARNRLAARLARAYVEALRNVPLLLQLFLWYALLTEALPPPRQAWQPLPGVFLSGRGLFLPAPGAHPAWAAAGWGLLAGLAAALPAGRWRRGRRGRGVAMVALVLAPPLAAWLAAGGLGAWTLPALSGFNFVGGLVLSPEFAALGLGLTLYSASYIAEIVRAGLDAVPAGQREAAAALGLKPGQALRLVVLPQALRVIVPPLAGQYLSLVKNSSLAVAIGYPDLVSVANTAINQTGHAIEGVAIIMAAYLSVSLAVAALMEVYNRRVALRGQA